MPRPHRIKGNDVHYHIILRCNNKEPLLQDRMDFERLLEMIGDTQTKFAFKLYNYVFLNSHLHMMLSTHSGDFIDIIMHRFCSQYAKDFNQRHKRSGHLWAHRYRSRLILYNDHGLACLRYQHRNPLAAGIVRKVEIWPWSGYHYYAFGRRNDLLEPHPSYLALAEDEQLRRQFYKLLVNTPIPSDKMPELFEGRSLETSRRSLQMMNQIKGAITQIKRNSQYQ